MPYNSDSYQYSSNTSKNFRSRGGFSILLLHVSVLFLAFRSYDNINASKTNYFAFMISVTVAVLAFPFSGWLGDVKLGRYKMVKYTVVTLWISTIMHSILVVIMDSINHPDEKAWEMISSLFISVWIIMYGSFMVNGFHLGADQLMDAPSWQLSSYFNWYCWSFFMAAMLKTFFSECLPLETINAGAASLVITLGLCLDFLFSGILVKEPVSPNSLKLIFEVLKYAKNNKYPRLRSAFGYWDDKKSRLNLAKSIYGGPFTSEEVEDVKTFLKVMIILILGSFFGGHFIAAANTTDMMLYHYSDDLYTGVHNLSGYGHCLVRGIVSNGANSFILLGIPLFEWLVHPFVWKYMDKVTFSKKFVVGMFFFFAHQCSCLALEWVGHARSSNETVVCLFVTNETTLLEGQTVNVSFYWLALPTVFSSIAYYLMFTSTAEFMYAQSPYSMKSFLMGILFSLLAVAIAISFCLRLLFRHFPKLGGLSCGIWYFILSTIFCGGLIAAVCLYFKWYSTRKRRDNVLNESQVLQFSSSTTVKYAKKPDNYYM